MKRACRCFYVPASCCPARAKLARAGRQHRAPASCRQSTHMPVVSLDSNWLRCAARTAAASIRNASCAFNYIIYPILVQCYVMGRFGHEHGPFWMLAGAVLVLFFLPLGPFWFQWAVFDLHWGRFDRFPLPLLNSGKQNSVPLSLEAGGSIPCRPNLAATLLVN